MERIEDNIEKMERRTLFLFQYCNKMREKMVWEFGLCFANTIKFKRNCPIFQQSYKATEDGILVLRRRHAIVSENILTCDFFLKGSV